MKKLCIAMSCLILCTATSLAQKGKADADYYPLGYSGDTWTGEVTAFDNDHRTLTLTYTQGKKVVTFVASISDAPYEWGRDAHNFRVVDFPFNKKANFQTFKYVGWGEGAGDFAPDEASALIQKRPNPPASNVITNLAEFMGRNITVYYTTQECLMGGKKEKYNDVWRIRILPGKKK
jgi:hypothetical protein